MEPKKEDRVLLKTESPDVRDKGTFAIEMPAELSENSYQLMIQHIEFRRKCMNQGFDNLLELLKMHWEAYQRHTRQE